MTDLVEDFKATLTTGDRLLKLQKDSAPAGMFADTVKGLVESLLTKACCIPLIKVEQVEEMHGLLKASVLEEEQQAKLMQVLTSRCFAGAGGSRPGATEAHVSKQSVQLLSSPSVFMTAADWVILEDAYQAMSVKVQTVCDRCRLLGCSHPSEVTFKHLATMLARVHCPDAVPDQLFGIVRELKQAFALQKGVAVGCSRLSRFPELPTLLPDAVLQSGYPDPADPPASRLLDGLHPIFARVPLRLSNRSIGGGSHPSIAQGSSQGAHAIVPQAQQDGASAIMSALGGLLQQLTGQQAIRPQHAQQQQGPPIITFCNPGAAAQAIGGTPPGARTVQRMPLQGSPTVKTELGSPASTEQLSDESQLQDQSWGRASSIGTQLALGGGPAAAGGGNALGLLALGSGHTVFAGEPAAGASAVDAAGARVAAKSEDAAGGEDLVAKLLNIAKAPSDDKPGKKVRYNSKTKPGTTATKLETAIAKSKTAAAKGKATKSKTPIATSSGAASSSAAGSLVLGCPKCRGTPHTLLCISTLTMFERERVVYISPVLLLLLCTASSFWSIEFRGADIGCKQCRDPAYKGKRGPQCKPKAKEGATKACMKAMKKTTKKP